MKIKIYLFLTIIFLYSALLFGQKNIGFEFDYAKFKYDENNSYFEIYYSITQKTFSVSKTDSGNFISAGIKILLVNDQNEKVINENYNMKTKADTASLKFQSEDLVGMLSYKVPFGKYDFKIEVIDNFNKNNSKSISEKIDFTSVNKIQISDIQLCSNIIREDANPNSIYFKNSLETIPNPQGIYGVNSPVMFYYLEVYNNLNPLPSNLKLKRVIYKNETIKFSDEENLNFSNNALVKAGFIKISKFSSGTYTLSINIVDSQNKLLANSSKKFYVFNPNVKEEENNAIANLGGNEFDLMDEEECDYTFDVSRFIAAKPEIDLYENLTQLEAKRKFLSDFWRKRDSDQNTVSNEYKIKYFERLDFANSNFGNKFKDGYKTDRGRVILLYGQPDRIDKFENESTIKPYEIWYYDTIEGGVQFIFGDTMGISDLELLHSTKIGEIRNESWGDRISIYDTNQ
ncbi:MAG: GWxTD domain-containing protein [Ignavibacteriales bacterium]|nr:GWxTD domain-containing protein [Ignavibacteriales bacterium]